MHDGTAPTAQSSNWDFYATFDIGGGFKMLTGGNTDVKNTEKQSTVVALKEWHIVYNCKTEIATLAPKKTFKKK